MKSRTRFARHATTALGLAIALPAFASPTLCRIEGAASFCSDRPPDPADANGYHNLPWVNLHKALASIAVSDNHVWGLDSRGVLWYLPDFNSGKTWAKVAVGVAQVSAGHNLVCQVNKTQHLLCAGNSNRPFRKATWFDSGAANFKQIAVSAGRQLWAVDAGNNLIQIKDYTKLAGSSTVVASGVQQVAVGGRGMVCQVRLDQHVSCANWFAPAATPDPWVLITAPLRNISAADGQIWGTDANGDLWQLPDYTNAATWFRIAHGANGQQIASASVPSQFLPAAFGAHDVAVLLFMGQSNGVGYNTLPARFMSPSSPNVWGVRNDGWNFLAGNKNGTVPFTSPISSITSVQWSNFALTPDGPDMNLGFNSNAGPGGNAANFAAYQWQGLVNAGWPLPDLYIIHIAWPSQGVDAADKITADVPWTKHGINLWQPGLPASLMPSYALAPFARRIVYLALQNLLANGKTPRLIGLQWNQWEAEAGNADPVSIANAPANYRRLFQGLYSAIGAHFPIQIVKPLAPYYSTRVLSEMQAVFAKMANDDPGDFSILDVSKVSQEIFQGGVLGGGDGTVHYNLDTHRWFAEQAIRLCLVNARCGVSITALPAAAPN